MPRRSVPKRLAKAQERFKAGLTEFIVSKGTRPSDFYDHEIDTPAGLLRISIHDNWIATRFDDVAEGRRFSSSIGVGCNPFSGKWNFHYSDDVTSLDPEVVIADFGYFLERLLDWRPNGQTTGVSEPSPATRNR